MSLCSIVQQTLEDFLLSDQGPYERWLLVAKLKHQYESNICDFQDILIPFHEMTLADKAIILEKDPLKIVSPDDKGYRFNYRWNNTPGKKYSEYINNEIFCENAVIKKGTVLDRLGSPWGRYVSPVTQPEKIYSICERALPYFCIRSSVDKEPAYHKYIATVDITADSIGERLKKEKNKNSSEMEYLLYEVKEAGIPYGTIAPVKSFGKQGDGLGIQYRFPVFVAELLALGMLKEICE